MLYRTANNLLKEKIKDLTGIITRWTMADQGGAFATTDDFKHQEWQLSQKILIIKNQDRDQTEKSLLLAQLYNNRGWSKYMQVEFDLAIEDYNIALNYCPNLAVALYNRGTIHYRMGQFGKAVEDLSKALELQRENKEFAEGLENARIQYTISLTTSQTYR